MKKLPHILVTLLVAMLVGCGTSNPLADEAQSNVEAQNYEAALTSAEKSIEQYPGDPRGYFYKAVALGSIAESLENPEERADYYKRMNESFEMARTVADTAESTPKEISRIDGVKQAHWIAEYKKGVDLATNDSLKKAVEDPMKKSLQHVENATIIQPDSANAWNALGIIAAQNQDFKKAAEAKSRYISMIPDTAVKVDDYLQVGSFYSSLKQNQKAIEVLEKGKEQYPKDADIISHLASNYITIGQPQKAISVFEQLVKQNPENAEYRLKMGSEIYNQALVVQDSLVTNSKKILELQDKFKNASESDRKGIKDQIMKLADENEQLQSQMEQYLTRAEQEVKTAIKFSPNDAAAYETLGIIHRFKAQIVFDKLNRTANDENEKAAALDKKGKELLRDAMGYYEKAAEINPDNKNYWKNLFQIYAALGMDEKAQDAMKKAGMN